MNKAVWKKICAATATLGLSALLASAAFAEPPAGAKEGQKGQGPRARFQQRPGGNQAGATTRPAGEEGDRPPRPDPDKLFDRVDTDGNGSLSREEFKEFLSHRPPPPPREGGEGGGQGGSKGGPRGEKPPAE